MDAKGITMSDLTKANMKGVFYHGSNHTTTESIEPVIQWIHEVNALPNHEQPGRMTLHLNCNGGSGIASHALACQMLSSKIPVDTVASGWIVSAGLYIFLAGDRRKIYVGTDVLTHQNHINLGQVKHKDFEDEVVFQKRARAQHVAHFMARTGKSKTIVEKELLGPREWWMTESEVLKYGIAHEVIDHYKKVDKKTSK